MCQLTDQGAPEWSDDVQKEAEKLVARLVGYKATFSSLPFKEDLRAVVGVDVSVKQEDTTKFLRQWFLKKGGDKTHTSAEKKEGMLRRTTYVEYSPK